MVKQTKQHKLIRSTSKKTKSRTRKHINRRVSLSNKMRGGAASNFQPNISFNKGSNPLLISGDTQLPAFLPKFADTSKIEVYYSDNLPYDNISDWTTANKVYTTKDDKRFQSNAYNDYMFIIENGLKDKENVIYIAKALPAPNKTYNINPNLYGVGGSITFTLSFYGIHKQTNLPILLMTKEKSKIGYLFAKNTLTTSEPYRSQQL